MSVTNVHPEVQKDPIDGMTPGEVRQKILRTVMDLRDGKINVEQANKITSEVKKHNAAQRAEMRRELVKQTEPK
jgi:hypothetical protein